MMPTVVAEIPRRSTCGRGHLRSRSVREGEREALMELRLCCARLNSALPSNSTKCNEGVQKPNVGFDEHENKQEEVVVVVILLLVQMPNVRGFKRL